MNTGSATCSVWLDEISSLSVLVSQGSCHCSEELVHSHVYFSCEISGKVHGQSYKDVMVQNLKKKKKKKIEWSWCCWIILKCISLIFNVQLYGQTLKFPGSTRILKACRSLRALKPPTRSSILPTASFRAPITVLPCFLTGAEPGLVSGQWAKYVFVWGYTTSILQERQQT